jgi:gliding motility-associated-like protein
MKKYFLLAVLFLLSTPLYSQRFYTTTGSGVNRVTVTPSGGSTTQAMNVCGPAAYYTIAVYKNIMYYSNGAQLYKADIVGNNIINCTLLMNVPNSNGLTVNSEGMLYLESGLSLYKIDPVAKITTNLGAVKFSTAGDMVFYKGNLYMASSAGGIAKIDLNNLADSKLVIPMSIGVFGMASVAYSSTQNKVYAFEGNKVIEIDLDKNEVVKTAFTLNHAVADAASEVEDGSLPEMIIDRITESADCPYTGKGTIQVICENALADYSYTLNGITNTTGVFSGLDPGTYQVRVSTTAQRKDATITVTAFTVQKPVVTSTQVDASCTTLGSITTSSTADPDLYKIKYGSNLFDLNHKFDFLNSGTYHFDVVSASGCIVDGFDKTLVREKCTIQYNNLQITQECNIIRKGNIKVITNTHFDLYTYTANGKWSNTTGVFNQLPAGTYEIKIKSEDDEKLVTAVVPDYSLTDPVVTTNKTNPYCAVAGIVNFNLPVSSAGYTVKYAGASYPLSNNFNTLLPGKHDFVLYKPSGCVLDSVSVDLVYEPCIIEIQSVSVVQECNVLGKGVIQVTGMPIPEEYTYYLNGAKANHTGLFTMLEPGTYTVKVTTSGGNTPKEIPVIVPDYNLSRPKYTVTKVNALCDVLGSIRIQVNTDPGLYHIQYKSTVYSFDHTFKDLTAGSYYFMIVTNAGCIVNELRVNVEKEECNPVAFPNTFTPNGDGINDIFRPNQASEARQYQLTVFNRHGTPLFISKDLHLGWNGEHQGKQLPVGTYYWIVSFVDVNNKPGTLNGWVSLVR